MHPNERAVIERLLPMFECRVRSMNEEVAEELGWGDRERGLFRNQEVFCALSGAIYLSELLAKPKEEVLSMAEEAMALGGDHDMRVMRRYREEEEGKPVAGGSASASSDDPSPTSGASAEPSCGPATSGGGEEAGDDAA